MAFRRLQKMEKKKHREKDDHADQEEVKIGRPKRARPKKKKRFGARKKRRK